MEAGLLWLVGVVLPQWTGMTGETAPVKASRAPLASNVAGAGGDVIAAILPVLECPHRASGQAGLVRTSRAGRRLFGPRRQI